MRPVTTPAVPQRTEIDRSFILMKVSLTLIASLLGTKEQLTSISVTFFILR